MIKSWFIHGIRNGILTTKYPKTLPTTDEIPIKSIPPFGSKDSDWLKGKQICPTNAIEDQEKNVDFGKCIFCRRCSDTGFDFEDQNEMRNIALQAEGLLNIENRDKMHEDFKKKIMTFRKSLHILMIDVGSCNACNLEVLNLSNPYYDLTRLGIFFTNSPKHADVLVVVGALNYAMVEVLKRTYESMPNPKIVISIGACSISGGIFQDTESFVSPIHDVIPVDVTVPGCPPTPIQILEGLLLSMGKNNKQQTAEEKHNPPD